MEDIEFQNISIIKDNRIGKIAKIWDLSTSWTIIIVATIQGILSKIKIRTQKFNFLKT